MVAALVNQLIAVGLGCSACSVAEPNPVPSKTPAIQASAPAVSDSACRVLDVALGTAGSITVGFPNRATCGAGLTLISGGAPSWSQVAIIRFRVLNHGTSSVQLPARVLLASSGIQIIGAGTPSNIAAVTPDSTLAGGVALWRTGGSGLLPPGDSTVVDTVKIGFAAPARHAKLTFGLDAMTVEVNPVPAVAPDSEPAWVNDDSSYTSGGSSRGWLKRTLVVLFKPTATQAERQAAVDKITGVVVGGYGIPGSDGSYLVRVGWNPTDVQLDSLASVLMSLPQVEGAGRVGRGSEGGRRPNDGVGWTPADWAFQPDSSSGQNWALEEIAAPLAWGCSTGDSATRVAVLDRKFDATEVTSNVVAPQPAYGTNPAELTRHGTYVAGILASPGDNGTAMTGVMWKAGLVLHNFGASPGVRFVEMARQIRLAASAGYRIVNLSYGALYPSAPGAGDAALTSIDTADMIRELRQIPAATFPLVVVPSGNQSIDAWYAVTPALRDAFPNNFLVVGGSQAAAGSPPRDRWGGSNFSFISFGRSGWGRLIDVYAPAAGVAAPTLSGGQTIVTTVVGTSFAAPMVTGIAGLLLSLDPSLTPAQLKGLIVEGAAKGGRSMPSDPTKYLANAYESLKLAAQRNPTTPVCGFPVALHGLPGAQYVVFEYTSAPRDSIPLPTDGGYIYYSLSVAQGGRLLADGGTADDVFENTPGRTLEYGLVNGQWSLRTTLAGVDRRIYTERDTVDQHYEYLGDGNEVYGTVIRRETRATQSFTFGLLAEPGAVTRREEPATFAPSGDYALVRLRSAYACDNHNAKDEVYLFDVSQGGTGGIQPFLYPSVVTCPAPGGLRPQGTAWAAASDRFLLALREDAPAPASFNTVMRSASGGGSSWSFAPDVTFPGVLLQGDGTVTPAGDLLYWAELDLQNESGMARCYDAVRQTASPYTYVSRSPLSRDGYGFATTSTDCFPEILNPAPNAAAADGSAAPRRRLDARHPRGPVRVQAN